MEGQVNYHAVYMLPIFLFSISLIMTKFILKREPVGFLHDRNKKLAEQSLRQIFMKETQEEIDKRFEVMDSDLLLCCRDH